MTDPWRERCARSPFVSRETLQRLDTLVARLGRWNAAINLVAPGSLATVWRRHVLDSLQLWPLAPKPARRWVDLGAGGGFPGLVIAAVAADAAPSMTVTLVESDVRKAAFLHDTAREMGVKPDIRLQRAELHPDRADVVSARALAPLPRLLDLVEPWLDADGVALLPKGERLDRELTAARAAWHSHAHTVPSLTDPKGAIVVMSKLRRV